MKQNYNKRWNACVQDLSENMTEKHLNEIIWVCWIKAPNWRM